MVSTIYDLLDLAYLLTNASHIYYLRKLATSIPFFFSKDINWRVTYELRSYYRPLFHYIQKDTHFDVKLWKSYCTANKEFANVVEEVYHEGDLLWVSLKLCLLQIIAYDNYNRVILYIFYLYDAWLRKLKEENLLRSRGILEITLLLFV